MRLEAQRLTVDCLTRLPQCPSAFTTSKRRIRTVGATKQGASINVIRLVSFRKRPPLLRGAKRSARQRSWQHCQQLGDLLRVAGGVGSYVTAEAVDGRAKAMQLGPSNAPPKPDFSAHQIMRESVFPLQDWLLCPIFRRTAASGQRSCSSCAHSPTQAGGLRRQAEGA